MGHQKLQILCMRRCVLRNLKPFGRGRRVAYQHGIEARRFMHLREAAHIVPVDTSTNDMHRRTAGGRSDTDHPENIDRHEISSTRRESKLCYQE